MEFYRAFEVLTDTQGTNHNHVLLHVMLIYMAAALPSRVKNGERQSFHAPTRTKNDVLTRSF